ncbi:hypothetical protein [Salinibius halmophilus]|uniref:hypothetical protein n=1 Tax=Salinibius halmophilus TaxID=1853216 RepID=UPI000E672D8C|nr:hypothetical protein [Salinibius halmophilus]
MRSTLLLVAITISTLLQAETFPWRLGVGVIADQQIYDNYDASNFPLIVQTDEVQLLTVPIIGYEAENWSIGTDGANYTLESGKNSYTLGADFTGAGVDYAYQINDFLSVGSGAGITFNGGLGWQVSANSTVLSATYGQLFSDPTAYIATASTGAPIWIKDGQPGFIATLGLTMQSKTHTLATANAPLNAKQLDPSQLTLSTGIIHFWELSDQWSYVIIAGYDWLPIDVQAQAKSNGKANLLSFITYRF